MYETTGFVSVLPVVYKWRVSERGSRRRCGVLTGSDERRYADAALLAR